MLAGSWRLSSVFIVNTFNHIYQSIHIDLELMFIILNMLQEVKIAAVYPIYL